MEHIRHEADKVLACFVAVSHARVLAARSYLAFGTDPIEELTSLRHA
jgi:hypothetical protein